jgi:hypothetical protein
VEPVQARVARDPAFRAALLEAGSEGLRAGDLETGKALPRDDLAATIGFEGLGAFTGRPAKSLLRMFGPRGNPQARNLFAVIACLQEREGLHLEVQAVRAPAEAPREAV